MSVSSLLGLVRNNEARKLAKARERYAALVANADAATEANAAELSAVMDVIGKSADDLAADLEAVAKSRELQKWIDHQPEAAKQAESTRKALASHKAQMTQQIAELEAQFHRLSIEASTASRSNLRAGEASGKLAQLKTSHPDIFDVPQPAPAHVPSLSPNAIDGDEDAWNALARNAITGRRTDPPNDERTFPHA